MYLIYSDLTLAVRFRAGFVRGGILSQLAQFHTTEQNGFVLDTLPRSVDATNKRTN